MTDELVDQEIPLPTGVKPKQQPATNGTDIPLPVGVKKKPVINTSSTELSPQLKQDGNVPAKPTGDLIEKGNIDLAAQPSVKNPETGGMSTVYSRSFNIDGNEVLLTKVTPDGKFLTDSEAVEYYTRTGKHLGIFKTVEAANAYAKQLHEDYESGKIKPLEVQKQKPPLEEDPFKDVQPLRVEQDKAQEAQLQKHVLVLQSAKEHPIFQPDQTEIASQAFVKENPATVGTAFLQKGDVKNAQQQFDAAIEKDPTDTKALIGKGYIAQQNDDIDAAINYYSQAAAQNNGNATMLLAGAQLKKATTAPLKGKIDFKASADLLNESLKNIDAVIVSNPDDLEAHMLKVKALEALGRKDEAIAERKASANLFLKHDTGVDANDNEQLAAYIGNGIGSIAGTAAAHFLNPPEFLNQVAQGVIEGNKEMSEGADQMNESNKNRDFTGYVAGSLKQLKGAMNTSFSAMMGMFPKSGYAIMQSMNAGDELTNGEASKLVFAPLTSLMEALGVAPTSDIGQSLVSFGDAGATLIGFGLAHQAINGNIEGAKKGEDILKKIEDGKQITVEEARLVNNELKRNLNPATVQRTLDAVNKMPPNSPRSLIRTVAPKIATRDELAEQHELLERQKKVWDEGFHIQLEEQQKIIDKQIKQLNEDIESDIKAQALKLRSNVGLPLGTPARETGIESIWTDIPEVPSTTKEGQLLSQQEKDSGITLDTGTKSDIEGARIPIPDEVIGEHDGVNILSTQNVDRFIGAMNTAKEDRPFDGVSVNQDSPEAYQEVLDSGGKIFLSDDNSAGGVVLPNGYMGGLFKHPSVKNNMAKAIFKIAEEHGGRFFDAFATRLENYYIRNGYRPVARVKFNEAYAPKGWENTELKSKPDVVFFVKDKGGKYEKGDGLYFDNYDEAFKFAQDLSESENVKDAYQKEVDSRGKGQVPETVQEGVEHKPLSKGEAPSAEEVKTEPQKEKEVIEQVADVKEVSTAKSKFQVDGEALTKDHPKYGLLADVVQDANTVPQLKNKLKDLIAAYKAEPEYKAQAREALKNIDKFSLTEKPEAAKAKKAAEKPKSSSTTTDINGDVAELPKEVKKQIIKSDAISDRNDDVWSNRPNFDVGTPQEYETYLKDFVKESTVKGLVYHISEKGKFEEFDPSKKEFGSPSDLGKGLLHFSTEKNRWLEYKKQKGSRIATIVGVVDLRNPYITKDAFSDYLDWNDKSNVDFIGHLKEQGYDGIIEDGGKQLVVFDKNQYKILGSGSDRKQFVEWKNQPPPKDVKAPEVKKEAPKKAATPTTKKTAAPTEKTKPVEAKPKRPEGAKPLTPKKVAPKVEVKTEPLKPSEPTAREKAKAERLAAKAKLDALKLPKGALGIASDPKQRAQALYDYHKALVKEGKEALKENIKTAKEFADWIEEKLTGAIRKAWDEVTGKIPKQTRDDFLDISEKPVDEEGNLQLEADDKSLLNRMMASDASDAAKKVFANEGLKYDPHDQQEARDLADAAVKAYGGDEAILHAEANRFGGDVNSAIFASAIDSMARKEDAASDIKMKTRWAKKWANYAIRYDEWLRQAGRGIAMAYHFYKNSELGLRFTAEKANENYIEEQIKPIREKLEKAFEDLKKEFTESEEFKSAVTVEVEKITAAQKAKKFADKVRRLKTKPLELKDENGNPIIIAEKGIVSWNDLVEGVAKGIEAGGKLIDVIQSELAKADWYTALTDKGKEGVRKQLEDHFGKAEEIVSKEDRRIQQLEKDIAEYDKKISEGDLSVRQKQSGHESPKVEELKKKRDERRKALEKLRKEKGVPEAKRIEDIKKSIADIQKQIDNIATATRKQAKIESQTVEQLKSERKEKSKELQKLRREKFKAPEDKAKRVLSKWGKKLDKVLTDKQRTRLIQRAGQELIENGALDFEDFRKMFAEEAGIDTLTPDRARKLEGIVRDIKGVEDAMKRFQESDPADFKQARKDLIAAQERARFAAKQYGDFFRKNKSFGDQYVNYMRLNSLPILSLMTNLGQYPFYMPLRFVETAVGTPVDWGLTKLGQLGNMAFEKAGLEYRLPTERTTNIFGRQRGSLSGFTLGVREGLMDMVRGVTSRDYFNKEINQSIKVATAWREIFEALRGERKLSAQRWAANLLEGTSGAFAEGAVRVMNLLDKPLRYSAEQAKAEEIGRRLGKRGVELKKFILTPSKEYHEVIRQAGERAVFQQSSLVQEVITAARQKLEEKAGEKNSKYVSAAAKTIFYANQPFLNTPINMFNTAFDYAMPEISFAKGILHMTGLKDFDGKEILKQDKAKGTLLIQRAIVGKAISMFATTMALNNIITPSQEDTNKEREFQDATTKSARFNMSAFNRFMSGQDSTPQNDDLTFDLTRIGILGTLMLIHSDKVRKSTEDEWRNQSFLDQSIATLKPTLGEGLQNGVFRGTSAIANAIQSGSVDQIFPQMLGIYLNALYPASIRDIVRSQQESIFRTKGETWQETFGNEFKQRFGATDKIPRKINLWGDPVAATPPSSNPILYYLFDVTKEQRLDQPQFGWDITDLYSKHRGDEEYTNRIMPPDVSYKFKYNKKEYDLQGKDQEALDITVGHARKTLAQSLISFGGKIEITDRNGKQSKLTWHEMNDDEKATALEKIYSQGYEQGKELYLSSVGVPLIKKGKSSGRNDKPNR